MKKNTPQKQQPVTVRKRILYTLILLLLPFLLLALVEEILRLSHYGQDFHLFINHPGKGYEAFRMVNPEIGSKYFQQFEYSHPANDIFLKKKEPGSFRIFVMGSSTVAGFPYEPNLMFTRILHYRLKKAYPDRRIEVINTAITAINSQTLWDFMPQILDEKPDAILIYAGHNEYYGAFGVGSNEGSGTAHSFIHLHLKLMNLKIYQFMRNVIARISSSGNHSSEAQKQGTLMTKIVKNSSIVYEGPDYRNGQKQFENNMAKILEKAGQHKVPVFLSTLVSNLRDLPPFGSEDGPDTLSAIKVYRSAQLAEQEGDFTSAKRMYIKAKDLDCVRFRASEEINTSISVLAEKYQAHLVPAREIFEEHSPHGIIGNNLITEHVHPNIEGYFLLADVFYNSIVDSKLIAEKPDLFTTENAIYTKKTYGYSDLDSLLGYHRIKNLSYHWPFVDEKASTIDYRLVYKPVGKIDSLAFRMVAKRDLTSSESHHILARYYQANGNLINAAREYSAIVQLNPAIPDACREAGSCYISSNDLPRAEEYFTQSLNIEQSAFALFRLGEISLIKNDFPHAISSFSKSYELADADLKVKILPKLYLGYIYTGQEQSAKQVLQALRQFKPGISPPVPPRKFLFNTYIPADITTLVEKANEYSQSQKFQEAFALLNKALEINDSPVVNRMIGELYLKEKAFESAWYFMEKAYSSNQFDSDYLMLMIQLNLSLHKTAEAKNCFRQLKTIDPNNPGIAMFSGLEK